MARFSLVFKYFGLAQRRRQVLSGDIAFSDDARVLHLYQRLFPVFGMELLQMAFSDLFCARGSNELSCITQHLQNLPFEKGYVQATHTFLTMRAGTRASQNVYLFP